MYWRFGVEPALHLRRYRSHPLQRSQGFIPFCPVIRRAPSNPLPLSPAITVSRVYTLLSHALHLHRSCSLPLEPSQGFIPFCTGVSVSNTRSISAAPALSRYNGLKGLYHFVLSFAFRCQTRVPSNPLTLSPAITVSRVYTLPSHVLHLHRSRSLPP